MEAFLLLLLFFGIFAVVVVRAASAKQDIQNLLSTFELTGDGLSVITSAVAAVNARGGDYTFGVERAAKCRLRGDWVWIVWGPVGGTVPGKYGPSRSRWEKLYAVADGEEQIAWMNRNPDLFLPVDTDPTFRVFWVDSRTLKANNALEATAA